MAGIDPINVYDLENLVPAAFWRMLTAKGINAATFAMPPKMEKPRPRCELVFHSGGAETPERLVFIGSPAQRYIAAYEGELVVTSITDESLPGKAVHSEYRASLRQLLELDPCLAAVNSDSTPYSFKWIGPSVTSATVKAESGYEMSTMSYRLKFAVKPSAFAQLLST